MADSTSATWRSDTKTALVAQSSVTLPANFAVTVQLNDIAYEVIAPVGGGTVDLPTVVADALIAGRYITSKSAATGTSKKSLEKVR